jgi:type IV pilus assembly protein PilM
MANRVVGLEIGPDFIRAAQIRFRSFGRVLVEKLIEVPTSGGIDVNGKIINPQSVGEQITRIWKSHQLSSKRVKLGLGGTDVFVREFSVPEMKPAVLKGALSSLAEGSLPMPTSELILDFYPSKVNRANEISSVSGLLLAATKSGTDSLLGAVQVAGLSPESIDLVAFALLRQLDEERRKDKVVAIVHASAGFLNMVVAKNQVPIFVRMVPTPILKPAPVPNVKSPTTDLTGGEDNAEVELVAQNAASETSRISIGEDIVEVQGYESANTEFQDAAIRELKDTLTYYSRNHQDEPISHLLTSGRGLDNSEWLTLLGQQIWLPTESHTIESAIVSNSGKVERGTVPTEFLVAYSLARGVNDGR